jgi:hypothetical protein
MVCSRDDAVTAFTETRIVASHAFYQFLFCAPGRMRICLFLPYRHMHAADEQGRIRDHQYLDSRLMSANF